MWMCPLGTPHLRDCTSWPTRLAYGEHGEVMEMNGANMSQAGTGAIGRALVVHGKVTPGIKGEPKIVELSTVEAICRTG